jgi:hypothetical protein
MTAPDLELTARLSADELRTHVAHDAQVYVTGRYVAAVQSDTRIGMSEKMQAGGCYRSVVVEKRLIARKQAFQPRPESPSTAGARRAR